jgi:hydroxymethylbilane synthase
MQRLSIRHRRATRPVWHRGTPIRLVAATRRSPLALAQTTAIAAQLAAHGHQVDLLEITTTGDRWSATPDQPAADRGMFVKELEEALRDGRADFAVHSAKDLPVDLPEGLTVAAVPPREDARDVLVGVTGGLAALAVGARVGTSSPRRQAQLAVLRPDVEVIELRGNVDTRLTKRDRGDVEALMLAAAGLIRLGIQRTDILVLSPQICVPAPGQGLLAIEARQNDRVTGEALALLDDPDAHFSLEVERAILRGMGGGCFSPLGALCVPSELGVFVSAFTATDATGTAARSITVSRRDRDVAGIVEAALAALGGDTA